MAKPLPAIQRVERLRKSKVGCPLSMSLANIGGRGSSKNNNNNKMRGPWAAQYFFYSQRTAKRGLNIPGRIPTGYIRVKEPFSNRTGSFWFGKESDNTLKMRGCENCRDFRRHSSQTLQDSIP